jgi:hypothetical protein
MRLMFGLSAAAAAAILFLGCGRTEEDSQNDLQALASSPAVTTPTPTPPPTDTPTPTPAPAAKSGTAPDGCLTSELAYVDPDGRFAFCYPSEMELKTADTGDGMVAANVAGPIDPAGNRVIVIWGLRVEPYELCGIDSPTVVKNQIIEDFTVAGMTVQACFKDHFDRTQPDVLLHKTIDFMGQTSGGQSVIVFVTFTGPNFATAEATSMRILDSGVLN